MDVNENMNREMRGEREFFNTRLWYDEKQADIMQEKRQEKKREDAIGTGRSKGVWQ
jgi:hypothetical protein